MKLEAIIGGLSAGDLKASLEEISLAVDELEDENSSECEQCADAQARAEEANDRLESQDRFFDWLTDAKSEIKRGQTEVAINLIDRCLPEIERYG